MSSSVTVSNLCKLYKLYWGPRSLFKEIFFRIPSHHELWALDHVSFEIQEGEAFGIVGDNGAGKTTLLKILTGTAYPTSGSVQVRGRVNALLELGTGFHPEFTGRENIYFNGALLGLTRREVQEQEEEIIDFSGLENFIDQPVKTYSSGMYLRLGFAIATGFEPSILIIDEALAVGDQRFQKKCTDRIIEFRNSGKTIIFCSHNLHQIKTLCERALWLDRGKPAGLGSATEVVEQYTSFLRQGGPASEVSSTPESDAKDQKQVCWIEKVILRDSRGQKRREFSVSETLKLEVRAFFGPEFSGTPGIGVSIVRNDGVTIYLTANTMENVLLKEISPGHFVGHLIFPDLQLLSGRYHFNVVTTDQDFIQAYHKVEEAEFFTVLNRGPDSGIVRLTHHWEST